MPVAIKSSKVDVLIIGAGPAGLMAANALARAGVNVRIIDKRPSKIANGHADGLQPRMLEVLQSYGLLDSVLGQANQLHMAAFYNPSPDGRSIELTQRVPNVAASTARYPFECTLHQGDIESMFMDSMSKHGVTVDRPVIPISMEVSEDELELADPTSHPVRVTLKTAQEDHEIVHAKFVLGTDGAHSWVRKQFNITMEGEQTDYTWGVVDMTPDTDFPDIRNKCAIHSDNGSCLVIPREGDKIRLYIQLEDKGALDAASARVDKNRAGPDQILQVAKKSMYPYTFNKPREYEWWTAYIIGQRVASQFSVRGRVFIAGDACHTHSPKAGQGMNAGMSDAHNLAWKMIHVLRGWADMSLLKTYEHERRKFAQDLINFDKNFAKLFSGKPRTVKNQDGVSHEEFLRIFQTFGGFTSGIGIHYSPSLITTTPDNQPLAKGIIIGQRMPPQTFIRAADARPVELQDLLPADTRFKILVFPGDATKSGWTKELEQLAKRTGSERGLGGYLQTSPSQDIESVDILTICRAKKENMAYTAVPSALRSHWSKVLLDDTDVRGRLGGDGYANYGIDPLAEGVIVVVRPDGYVGAITSFENVHEVEVYFSGFRHVKRGGFVGIV